MESRGPARGGGVYRKALALLEADPWPGNVRELERVVYRAVAVRRRGAVQPEDVRLPDLRRKAPVVPAPALTAGVAGPAITATLTRYHAEALSVAAAGGEVRRGDLMARCGISRDRARRTLGSLVEW